MKSNRVLLVAVLVGTACSSTSTAIKATSLPVDVKRCELRDDAVHCELVVYRCRGASNSQCETAAATNVIAKATYWNGEADERSSNGWGDILFKVPSGFAPPTDTATAWLVIEANALRKPFAYLPERSDREGYSTNAKERVLAEWMRRVDSSITAARERSGAEDFAGALAALDVPEIDDTRARDKRLEMKRLRDAIIEAKENDQHLTRIEQQIASSPQTAADDWLELMRTPKRTVGSAHAMRTREALLDALSSNAAQVANTDDVSGYFNIASRLVAVSEVEGDAVTQRRLTAALADQLTTISPQVLKIRPRDQGTADALFTMLVTLERVDVALGLETDAQRAMVRRSELTKECATKWGLPRPEEFMPLDAISQWHYGILNDPAMGLTVSLPVPDQQRRNSYGGVEELRTRADPVRDVVAYSVDERGVQRFYKSAATGAENVGSNRPAFDVVTA